MNGRQCVADVDRDGQELLRREPSARLHAGRQRFAVQELHDEVRRSVRQVPVVDHFDDIGVPRETQRLRLAPQTIARDGFVRGRRPQELDRHGHPVRDADGFVDDARRTGPHPPHDPVLPRRHRAFELAPRPALVRLFQREAALERIDPHLLGARLRAAHLLAREHRPEQRPAEACDGDHRRTDDGRNTAARRTGRRERQPDPQAEDEADRSPERAARQRIRRRPRDFVVLGNARHARARFRHGARCGARIAEERRHRRKLREAREAKKPVDFERGIVTDAHAPAPSAAALREGLPARGASVLAVGRIHAGERFGRLGRAS